MKRLRDTVKQRGVALMMTLGVLALLLIMAMSFAYTTRTERLAAGVNTDLVRARLLAESGLERAIGFIREQYANNPAPGNAFYVPVPATSEAYWVSRMGRYFGSVGTVKSSLDTTQHHIQEALASTVRVAGTAYQFTPASRLHDAIGWIPIKVDHGTGTESCIGLVGYLVIDETGKIDPSTAVGSVYGDSSESTTHPDTRLGLDLREVSLSDCYLEAGTYSYGDPVATEFATDMPSPGRWDSMHHIMNRITGANQAWLYRFIWSLRPFSVEETESYQNTPGGVPYHRCDINGISWNSTDVASFPTGALDASQPYNASAIGLPWGTQILNGDAIAHNQVLANIIDFLDDDVGGSAPTDTENNYVASAGSPPTDATLGTAEYVGLEEVPYINEVFIRGRYVQRFPVSPTPPPTAIEANMTVEAAVELVNMYGQGRTIPSVQLDVQVSCTMRTAGQPDETQTFWLPVPFSWSSVSVGAQSYATTPWVSQTITPNFSVNQIPGSARVYFQILAVRVVAAGATPPSAASVWDVAVMNGPGGEAPLDRAGIGMERSAGTNDPRCNTLASQWTWSGAFAGSSGGGHASGTPDGQNDQTTSPSVSDAETLVGGRYDPINTSTAFVRNGAILSFWELGAIHRGEPWRTLNLHSADLSQTVGSYEYGDWQLLNQVRLLTGAITATRGQVNVWDVGEYVWKPLLQGVRYGSSYADPASSGTALTNNAQLSAAAAAIYAGRPAWAADMPHGRGALVAYGMLSDGSLAPLLPSQGTDALREEIIGKLVGLFNDRISYYTILVCALAVNEVGPLPTGMTVPQDWIEYEAGRYCRPMAEQKVMATVCRDVTGNRFWIAGFQYVED